MRPFITFYNNLRNPAYRECCCGKNLDNPKTSHQWWCPYKPKTPQR